MKAIILAAGRGSRLGSLTSERPKGLVELGGRSLITRAIESLKAGGCSDIGIVTGYRAELLNGFGNRRFHNPRWAETNMVVSLTAAADWLKAEPIVVSYSDIFYTSDTVQSLRASQEDITVAYDKNWRALWEQRSAEPLSDAESFRLDSDGRLVDIGRRPVGYDDIQGQYMGLLKFMPSGWAQIEAQLSGLEQAVRDKLDMTGLLSRLLAQGVPVGAVAQSGLWGECDTPSDLIIYEQWRRDGRLS